VRRYVLVNCALYHGRPWQQQQQQMLGHHSAAFRRLLRQLLICAIHGDLCVSSSIHFLPPRQPCASNLKRGGDTSNVLVNTHSPTATSVVATLRHRNCMSHFDYYPENARKQYKSGSVEPAQCPGQCARDGRADRRVVIKFAQFAVWSRRRLRY